MVKYKRYLCEVWGVYEGGCIGFGDKNDQRGGWKLRLIKEEWRGR